MRQLLSRFGSLSARIPLLLIASALTAALAVGINSHVQATKIMVRSEVTFADSIARFRAGVLKRVGDGFASDLRLIADAPAIREAYEFLSGVYDQKGGRDDAVHKHYVGHVPPQGKEKRDYQGQDDRSAYGIGHKRWHPMLRAMADERKFYDLFLISPAGEVIYTVEKESDFGTNLRTGPWRGTGLARAFEAALAGAEIAFEDYEPYTPSNGAAAAFMARAVRGDDGRVLAVLAVQLPDNAITAAISHPFSDTGAVYALGLDGRLRTAVETRGRHKLFDTTPYAEAARSAFSGDKRFGGFVASLDGAESYVSMAPVEFMGRRWAIVADIKRETIDAKIHALALRNGMVGIVIVLTICGASLLVARNITKPVNAMRDAVGRLAAGEKADIPGEQRQDELGDLARSLRQVHDAGVAAAQVRAGLDMVGVSVMITDLDGKIVYVNKALLNLFRSRAESFRKQFPNFSAEQMIGATVEQFHNDDRWKRSSMERNRIKIDNLTIEINVNSVLDADGNRIGTVVEWQDLTAELSAMAEVTQVVEAAVRGDFSGRVRLEGRTGAMHDLAQGLNRINTIVETAMDEFNGSLRQVADGDLTVRVAGEHQGRIAELATGINDTVSRLAETVATIQRSARDLSRAAREINAGASDLAKRTEEEASSLEETAATTEELAASVKQTADNSSVAQTLSDKAKNLATGGGKVVHDAIDAMERIEEASRKISDIISVIDDIAFQTNLLALNAAVEAARAGEAGKGFAVVASEVRALAQRSGQAARDIKDLIVGSASQVVEGVKLVHATGQSLNEIVRASDEVAQMIAMIHSASSEQANGIEEMSTAVARIDEMTQQNSALAEESAASASELTKQLERLDELVATFRIDDAPAARAPAPAPTSEPDRLRQLAAEAFQQSRVTRPGPAPAAGPSAAGPVAAFAPPRTAAGGSRLGADWTEF
jgi:methyl-accepting chemotaxis protein